MSRATPPGSPFFNEASSVGRSRAYWVLVLVLVAASRLQAQTTTQLWGNVTLDWVRSAHVTYGLDFEPKVLVSAPAADPGWWALDVTPSVDYAASRWFDLIGELGTAYTAQTDAVNSMELAPRAGVRLHLFSRDLPTATRLDLLEWLPKRRVVLRDLARVEARNLFYTGDGQASSSTVRFRNRIEFLAPLNKEKLTTDGAIYVLSDWEWFIPIGDPAERFSNKQRIRAGLGYRRDVRWRFEALYIRNRSRNTIEDGYQTTDHALDIRLKRVF